MSPDERAIRELVERVSGNFFDTINQRYVSYITLRLKPVPAYYLHT